jgi:DNA-binding NarL/FixJ family response regulator
MINLFLIDEQITFIKSIKEIFEGKEGLINVVGSATNCDKVTDFFEKNEVHILLIDPSANDIIISSCLAKVKNKNIHIKIIVLTNELDIHYLNNLWNAGVDGIELKNCGKKALLNIINRVMEGERVLGKKIPDFINESIAFDRKIEPKLSLKEKEIYQQMLVGINCDGIAKNLKLPLIAVQFHCKNILKKFNKNSLSTLVNDSKKNQLVS